MLHRRGDPNRGNEDVKDSDSGTDIRFDFNNDVLRSVDMTYGMNQQKEAKAWSVDLETEQYAEQLLNDSDVIGELTSDIATANEDALSIAIQSAIGGNVTALNQMFWDAAIVRAREEIEQPADYDTAA